MRSAQRDQQGSGPPTGKRVDLTTTLYKKLHQLAAGRMAQQFGPQTLQATALIHEAWLRLGGDQQPEWNDRTHFFAAVADAMRHILIDRARRRQRIRHGGGLQRVNLEAWNWEQIDPTQAKANDDTLLLLNEALEKFSTVDPQSAAIVKLHYFGGLTLAEIGECQEISSRTAMRRLSYARAWLGREIRRGLAA